MKFNLIKGTAAPINGEQSQWINLNGYTKMHFRLTLKSSLLDELANYKEGTEFFLTFGIELLKQFPKLGTLVDFTEQLDPEEARFIPAVFIGFSRVNAVEADYIFVKSHPRDYFLVEGQKTNANESKAIPTELGRNFKPH